jgi:hypothetical protein
MRFTSKTFKKNRSRRVSRKKKYTRKIQKGGRIPGIPTEAVIANPMKWDE